MHDGNSSWGQSSVEVDVRTLRIYNRLLSCIATIGEYAVIVLLLSVTFGIVTLIFYTNFENVRFYDGTDLVCIFNGETGEISDERE